MRHQLTNAKTFFAGVILVGIIFVGFSRGSVFIREKFFRILVPLFHLTSSVAGRISNVAGGIFSRDSSSPDEYRLKALEADRAELNYENATLRRSLFLGERNGGNSTGAEVLLYGNELGKELIILDRGARDGISVGDPVVDDNRALVGFVREVTDDQAKVAIAANPGEIFEVEFVPLGIRAIAKGIGAHTFAVELIPSDAVIRPGDFLILKKGGILPIFLGEIARDLPSGGAALKEARAVMLARPEKISFAFVLSLPH